MAINAACVLEVRSSGATTNGGGFKVGATGTDFSQQDAAQYALTGCSSAAANAIILNANAAANMVGNLCQVVSGTNATAGFYEITSVSLGVSITVDRNWCSAAAVSGVVNVGGAYKWGGALDANFAAVVVAGNQVWIKGNGTPGASLTWANSTGASLPIKIDGYQTTRGDTPLTANQPVMTMAANQWIQGQGNRTRFLSFTGTGTSVVSISARGVIHNCKVTNTSTTADRAALDNTGSHNLILNCELVSYRGIGIKSSSSNYNVIACYIHDCNVGLQLASGDVASTGNNIINNLIVGCVTSGIYIDSAHVVPLLIYANTVLGFPTTATGTGLNITDGSNTNYILNNIFFGLVAGIADPALTEDSSYSDYNDFNGNTNARTGSGIVAGAHDVTTAPSFTDATEVSGSTATTSAGNLVDAGKNFTTAGVVAGRDYLYLVSGTGITAGIYGISVVGTTTLTPDIAPGNNATGDKVYRILRGRNFAIGSALAGIGTPGAFSGGYTTSYPDLGAVQRTGVSSSARTFNTTASRHYSVPVQSIRLDYSANNVTTASYVQLDSALDSTADAIEVHDAGGYSMKLAIGASSAEQDIITYASGGTSGIVPMPLSAGQRLSIKAVGGNVSTGELIITLWR